LNDFYEQNHRQYFESTVGIDPSAFLEPLAVRLKPGAAILDVGCGSGRDLRWFVDRGFRPTGFEKSPALAGLARRHSGCPVIRGDFLRFDFSRLRFDALVIVGALVHVPRDSLAAVLQSICRVLAPGGLALVTLKEGSGSFRSSDGRVFTLWSAGELEGIFASIPLQVLDFSRSPSEVRPDDAWLGFVLRRPDAS